MTNDKSFIEVQFPISKVSKESYKERKAVQSQTLTGLGKWWGRKPLILVRAAILGLLLPASSNPHKDREIFLKLLSMDESAMIKRKRKSIPSKIIYNYLTPSEKKRYFEEKESYEKIEYKKGISRDEKQKLQNISYKRMSYDEKLEYCIRPEEIDNLDVTEWNIVNEHLGTNADSLPKLIIQLGMKMFNNIPIVGDCFCGGGSIPFEAARMGCKTYASDLNPVAGLLTWASLKVLGVPENEKIKIENFLDRVYKEVDKYVTISGIEQNEEKDRAIAYLYCNEIKCPECGWEVPLSSSWVVGVRAGKVIAKLIPDENQKKFSIIIKQDVSEKELREADNKGTIKNAYFNCPHCKASIPISSIRRDKKLNDNKTENELRLWNEKDYKPNIEDIFQERLYCIRWQKEDGSRYYAAPTVNDLERENKVLNLLKERFSDWIKEGYIPSNKIESGDKTDELIRTRGWTYWHHLFNPRQLLVNSLLTYYVINYAQNVNEIIMGALAINRCCDYNSKLCRWDASTDTAKQTFYNQAFNTMFDYASRSLGFLKYNWYAEINWQENSNNSCVEIKDARDINSSCNIWITDPPYADAVNYHELSEFFLAWDKKILLNTLPNWYADSKRILAVKGTGETFNNSMLEVYKNLAYHMPENGKQIVMFTHQNVSVWADLTMILWASGLRVTAAWNITTETDASGIKQGNYVKGTVLLVLRKQSSERTAYLDELYPEIEEEVKSQIDSMRELDDKEDPNFTDADYLLAAYAASLKVLTSYKQIEDIDVKYELSKVRMPGEESPIEKIINEAVKIAYDYLIPSGFDQFIWKLLIPEERFYIKGLDLEKEGVYQVGAYQELARGFGVREYKEMLESTKANQARLKTALEFGIKGISDNDRFGTSVLRNVLVALYQSIKEEDTSKGRNWIKNELPSYWQQRNTIIEILGYISTIDNIGNMSHWAQEAKYAKLLRELIKNDGV